MKVLSFGHIPASVGGLQSSGLANVIYRLAYHGAKQDGVEMYLAATDVFVPKLEKDQLTILGWTKSLLIKHALVHPFATMRIIFNTIRFKTAFSPLVSVPGLLLKSIFLDYAIKRTNPDVVHLHGAHSVMYYHVLPQNVKLVVTLHGNVGCDNNLPNVNTHAEVERTLCSSERIDRLCTISSTIPKILQNMYGGIKARTQVILNAYDNKAFHYIDAVPHNKLTLCTIASFSKLKGQERVIEALSQTKVDCKYVCIGHISDTDKTFLEQKARDIDFEWLGIKKPSEIREILAECDYMILPSSTEGFGLVYLEAIACGVPVIIPKHLPLALEGDILNDRNSIRIEDSSSEAISAILPSLSTRTWNRKEVAKSVVSSTWGNIAKQYSDLYKSLIG